MMLENMDTRVQLGALRRLHLLPLRFLRGGEGCPRVEPKPIAPHTSTTRADSASLDAFVDQEAQQTDQGGGVAVRS